MTLYIKRLWSQTPPLANHQIKALLELYRYPFVSFEDNGRAYRIGFETALSCMGYSIENKSGGNDDE